MPQPHLRHALTYHVATALLALFTFGMSAQMAAAELGSPDHTVSKDQPFNWRGDYSGRFPAASPVSNWDEHTGEHIMWRTRLPGYGCEDPLLVKGKLICLSNPGYITCLDAKTGSVVWQHNEFDLIWPKLAKLPEAEKQHVEQAISDHINAQVFQGFKTAKGIVESFEAAESNAPFSEWVSALKAGNHSLVETTIAKGSELPQGGTAKTPTYVYKNAELLRKHGIEGDTNAGRGYMRWCGMIFVPPISDGERIYARFRGNRWVAYGLDGERLWQNTDGMHRRDGHPNLKWVDPHPGILFKGKLLTPGAHGVMIIDPVSGKTEQSLKVKLNAGRNYSFIPYHHDGQLKLLTRNGLQFNDDFSIGQAANKDMFTGHPGPKNWKRPFGEFGALQVGDRIFTAFGGYAAKSNTGMKVWRIAADGRFTPEKPIILNQAPLSEQAKKRSKHGKWKADTNWRGFVAGDKHLYMLGANHWVSIIDIESGTIADFLQFHKGRCDGTNQPIFAGGKVYVPSWSGHTAVFDDATAELLSVNRTEPFVSTGFVAKGQQLYGRGIFHAYCIGAP